MTPVLSKAHRAWIALPLLLALAPGLFVAPATAASPLDCLSGLTFSAATPAADGWDYGDAPDSSFLPYTTFYTAPGAPIGAFPTLAATANSVFGTPGARHREVTVGWLGNIAPYGAAPASPLLPGDVPPTLEIDADAFPDEDLTITNLDPATLTPDHDGRDDSVYPGTVPVFGPGTVSFRASSTPGVTNWYVNILIDWDYNGVWTGADPLSGAPEWVTVNMPVTVPALSSVLFTTPPFPTGSTPGEPWLRITLSSQPVPPGFYGPAGWEGAVPPGVVDASGQRAFRCGETEDYCGQITVSKREGPPTGGHEAVLCVQDDGTCVTVGQEGEHQSSQGPGAEVCDGDNEEHEEPEPDPPAPCPNGAYADLNNIHAGAAGGDTGPISATGNTGTSFASGYVSSNGGLDVDIAYECIDTMTLEVYKTWPDPSAGPIFTKSYGTGCGTGTLSDKIPVGFDNGEYRFDLTWTACDATTGLDQEFVYIYDPPIFG